LIQLTVRPATAPKPALRYHLLPEIKELHPGNPAQSYLKCFVEQRKFFFDEAAFGRREKLLVMPLKELPAESLERYGERALSHADWAARLDNPDWQILQKVQTEGIALLLPDLGDLRSLAPALRLRFRAELALGHLDKAIRTAQTMFAIARHLGEHPTLVASVLGIYYASTAASSLDEMLEQPGCPNLYWALTNLPNPLVPVDKGMEGERASLLWEFRDLDETAPMSVDRLKKFILHTDALLGDGSLTKPGASPTQAWLNARTKNEETLSAARARLVAHGLPQDRVLSFPAEQVILLDEKREYEERFDDLMKTTTLPGWQAEVVASRMKRGRQPALFADAFLPAEDGVYRRLWRLEQRIALLRHVEALRLFAAEHSGKLPAKLSEISVPLPEDPFTGKPFRYEASGTTAHLRGSPPLGKEKDAEFNIHYELTLHN
jgi:hypothetical protein